jgi:hypothetical protein
MLRFKVSLTKMTSKPYCTSDHTTPLLRWGAGSAAAFLNFFEKTSKKPSSSREGCRYRFRQAGMGVKKATKIFLKNPKVSLKLDVN